MSKNLSAKYYQEKKKAAVSSIYKWGDLLKMGKRNF